MSDNKENIAPNHRRKAVASSAFSPGKKCLKNAPNRRKAVASPPFSPDEKRLKKTVADSKDININVDSTTIHRMKTL
eukprot:scaffold3329_cov76-Alexandrium_tamarense.AAC.1